MDSRHDDARGRYEEGKGYATAKPSLNWRVVNKTDELEKEQCLVWLNRGITKIAIDGDATEVKVPSSALITVFEDMRAEIEAIAADRGSDDAVAFHRLAIKQAKPKTAPAGPAKTEWRYDADTDRYIAV